MSAHMHPPSPPPRLQKKRAARPSRQRQPAVPLSPAKLHATNRPRLTVTVSTPNRDSRAASTPLGIREGVYPRLPVSTPWLGIHGIPGTLTSSPPSSKKRPTESPPPPRAARRRLRLGEADFSSNLTTFAATAERHRPEVLFATHRYYSKSLHY